MSTRGWSLNVRARTAQWVLGVGHRLVDQALAQACGSVASVAAVPDTVLEFSLYVYSVTDRVTSSARQVRFVTAAVEVRPDGYVLLRDSELILRLNQILATRDPRRFKGRPPADIDATAPRCRIGGPLACGSFVRTGRSVPSPRSRLFVPISSEPKSCTRYRQLGQFPRRSSTYEIMSDMGCCRRCFDPSSNRSRTPNSAPRPRVVWPLLCLDRWVSSQNLS